MPAFIAVAVVAVAALVFGIFMFLGKNSEADKKEDAQEELASTRRDLRLANDEIDAANEEIADLEEEITLLSDELGLSADTAAALADLVGTGRIAADGLYDCALTAVEIIANTIGSTAPDPGQFEAVRDRCINAENDYNTFIAALNAVQ